MPEAPSNTCEKLLSFTKLESIKKSSTYWKNSNQHFISWSKYLFQKSVSKLNDEWEIWQCGKCKHTYWYTHTLIPNRMYVISGVLLKRPGMSQGLMMSSITLMLLTHTSQIPPPSKVQRRGGEARVYIEWLALVFQTLWKNNSSFIKAMLGKIFQLFLCKILFYC